MSTELTTIENAPLAIDQHPVPSYLSRLLSSKSRYTMRKALEEIAQRITGNPKASAYDVAWENLRFQHTAAIRAKLSGEYSPASVRKMLSALRGVLKACWRLKLMSADDYYNAIDIEKVRGTSLPAGRALSGGEIKAIIDVCVSDKTAAGRRDAAIVTMLYSCGLRRAEICSLQLEDYNVTDNSLVVHGKGDKERFVYIINGALEALNDWLLRRGRDSGVIFCPVNKGGRVIVREMEPEAIFNMFRKRGTQAGVDDISPHDFRRTFVSDLLDAGADISTVQKLVGHSSVSTTQRYDRRGEVAKRKAVELLNVPYHSQ